MISIIDPVPPGQYSIVDVDDDRLVAYQEYKLARRGRVGTRNPPSSRQLASKIGPLNS